MTKTTTPPKRRGRPPKAKTVQVAPKRRGRPPKAATAALVPPVAVPATLAKYRWLRPEDPIGETPPLEIQAIQLALGRLWQIESTLRTTAKALEQEEYPSDDAKVSLGMLSELLGGTSEAIKGALADLGYPK